MLRTFVVFAVLVLSQALAETETLSININLAVKQFFPDIGEKTFQAIRNAGYDVEVVEFPTARATAMIQAGQLDGDVFRLESYDQAVPNARAVPFATETLTMVAVVRGDSPFQTLEDVQDKRLATLRGGEIYKYVAGLMGKEFIALDTFDQAIKFIETGRADFTLLTPELIDTAVAQGANLRYIEEPITQVSFYLWLHKKHENKLEAIAVELEKLFTNVAD